jgi:hypothetical protein
MNDVLTPRQPVIVPLGQEVRREANRLAHGRAAKFEIAERDRILADLRRRAVAGAGTAALLAYLAGAV